MIVVMIIGIVYALVLSNFNTKKKVHILHIKEIKEALIPFWSKGKRIDFYLYDKCTKAALFVNNRYQEELKADIAISEFKDIQAYRPDAQGQAQKIEFTPIMIEDKLHKVCFRYTLFPNGSNSHYILKQNKTYYLFYPYFQDVISSQDLEEAVDLLQYKSYRGVRPDEVHD